MGPKRDEILKRIQEEKNREKHVKKITKIQKPLSLRSRMPIGCWIWIALVVIAAFALLKKYAGVYFF